MYKQQLTILTPAYNRGNRLHILYESLMKQTDSDFQWLIIDDGSTDNTKEIVRAFDAGKNFINYYRKENGGKHTALNFAHPYIQGEWTCIVDSDDYLTPDAVSTIKSYIREYESNKNVKCLTFQRGRKTGIPLVDSFPDEPVISNHIQFRRNEKRAGDCCEVLHSDVLKEFPFPEHPGERFMGEGYLWNKVAFKYDTVYIKKVIYICEYLEGGLTKSGKKLRIQCPLGGMDSCNSFFEKPEQENRIINKETLKKEALLFVCYGKFAGLKKNQITRQCLRPDLIKKYYLPGSVLYWYWKLKYMR